MIGRLGNPWHAHPITAVTKAQSASNEPAGPYFSAQIADRFASEPRNKPAVAPNDRRRDRPRRTLGIVSACNPIDGGTKQNAK